MELLGFLLRLILEPVIKLKAFLLLEIKWKKVALPLKKKRIDAASKAKEAPFERIESLERTSFQARKKDFSKNFWRMNEKGTLELISHENSRYLLKIYVIKSRKKGPTSNCLLNPGLRLSALTPRMSFAGIFANSPNRFLWPSISSFQMLAFSYWRLRPVTELTAISLPR